MENLIEEMDSLIYRFTIEGRKFVEIIAFPYGLLEQEQSKIKSERLDEDFQYFALAKSTKTLISIEQLLKLNHNEDVFILTRSIFENYLSSKYVQENPEQIDSFIAGPLGVVLAHYKVKKIDKKFSFVGKDNEVIGLPKTPSDFHVGADTDYYPSFYAFLCTFAHCNYGIFECYMEGLGSYTLDKVNHAELSRLFTVFTYSKIFENVVTVDGEEFIEDQEVDCYQLVLDSKRLQKQVFDRLIEIYSIDRDEFEKPYNTRMVRLLRAMKESLKEEVGSVKYVDEE